MSVEPAINPWKAPLFGSSQEISPALPVPPTTTSAPAPESRLTQQASQAEVPSPCPQAQPATPATNTPSARSRRSEHSLSRTVAAEYGLAAAVVMKYLAHCIKKSGVERDGHRWFRVNLDHLAEIIPYFSRSCLADTLQRLSTGETAPLRIHQANRRGYDRTNNYAFTDPQLAAQTRTHPRYFDPEEAANYGLPAALILHNLRHWEDEREATGSRWRTVQPGELAKRLPLSPRQARDALKQLVEDGVLEPRLEPGYASRQQYRLAAAHRKPPAPAQPANEPEVTIPDEAVTNLDGPMTNPDMGLPDLDMGVTKPDDPVTNLDTTLTNPDNDNSYQLSLAAPLAAFPQQPKNYPMRSAEPRAVGVPLNLSLDEAADRSFDGSQQLEASACRHAAHVAVQPGAVDCGQPSASEQGVATSPCRVAVESVCPPPNGVPSGWPADFSTLWHEVRKEVLGKLESEPSRIFDEQVCWRVIKPLLDQQPVELLDRWYACASWQANYLEMIKQVEGFQLPSLPPLPMGWDDSFLRRVMVAYLTSIFSRQDVVGFHQCRASYAFLVDYVLGRLMKLWNERAEAIEHARRVQVEEEYRQLQQQHRSKDADNEDDANRSAAEKVKILQNGIVARNRIGWLTNQTHHFDNLLGSNHNSLKLARQFFELNPEWTPGHLLQVMDASACYIAEHPSVEEFDPRYDFRKGANLTSLLKELNAVLTAAEMFSRFPAFTELPAQESAG